MPSWATSWYTERSATGKKWIKVGAAIGCVAIVGIAAGTAGSSGSSSNNQGVRGASNEVWTFEDIDLPDTCEFNGSCTSKSRDVCENGANGQPRAPGCEFTIESGCIIRLRCECYNQPYAGCRAVIREDTCGDFEGCMYEDNECRERDDCPPLSDLIDMAQFAEPTAAPSASPTSSPTLWPTKGPTSSPSKAPTNAPIIPIDGQTSEPTETPTAMPSESPTLWPTSSPSMAPTYVPSVRPAGWSAPSNDN